MASKLGVTALYVTPTQESRGPLTPRTPQNRRHWARTGRPCDHRGSTGNETWSHRYSAIGDPQDGRWKITLMFDGRRLCIPKFRSSTLQQRNSTFRHSADTAQLCQLLAFVLILCVSATQMGCWHKNMLWYIRSKFGPVVLTTSGALSAAVSLKFNLKDK